MPMRHHSTTFPWLALTVVLLGAVPAFIVAFLVAWSLWNHLISDVVFEFAGKSIIIAIEVSVALGLGGLSFYVVRRFWRELEEWRFGPHSSGPVRLF